MAAGLGIHEACNIFPMMSDEEFAALKADIAANGQREPIWTYRGEVIDGRHRHRGCVELGIEPRTREWDGRGSLVGFVVSLNLHRRHLGESQRAIIGARLKGLYEEEARARQAHGQTAPGKTLGANLRQASKGKASTKAAEAVSVSGRLVESASKVLREGTPDLVAKVERGELKVSAAVRHIERQRKREQLQAIAAAGPAAPVDDLEPWQVVEGDCVEVMGELRPGCARLVFADPPYNLGVGYGDHHDDRMPPERYLDWSRSWIFAAARLLAPDGSMWVLINHEWAARVEMMLGDAGLHMRAWITWYESFGVNCPNNFNRTSRRLLCAVRDPEMIVFNRDAVNRPSDRQAKYGDKRADPEGKTWDDVWGINPPIPRLVGTAEERIPDFPTQLPLALLTAVVGCASEPGDWVVDPFSGSGTTGVAAVRLGRRYIGIEKSGTFAGLSRARISSDGLASAG
jgi:DNA modification methylase